MWTQYKGRVYPPVNIFDSVCAGGMHGLHIGKGHFPIQINHYYTKSLKEYEKKISKGDVYFKINPHSDRTFYISEMKCGAVDVSIYKYLILLKQNMGISF